MYMYMDTIDNYYSGFQNFPYCVDFHRNIEGHSFSSHKLSPPFSLLSTIHEIEVSVIDLSCDIQYFHNNPLNTEI